MEQNGRYTANWDSLLQFIEHGQVPVIVRTEKITQLSYGEEKVEVKIDTINYISAKDKIFKKNHAINATADGIFEGFVAKEGAASAQLVAIVAVAAVLAAADDAGSKALLLPLLGSCCFRRQHQHQHHEYKEVEVGEETSELFVVLHVSGCVDVDQSADACDDHRHEN